ncbi:peptide-binding protein [Leptospira wolffii]|uniref:Omp85 family outer membrane protein n=1 Tax=Leptospira wolffii TaxID=409998 RepID=UPI0010841A2B|nr:DUF5982 domain-containing protein [Leptospira wolffii]TGK56084.1 peptide-binding protein [Leptospira wolffii]TGK72130.1 peptide-binding protein [Leptospira wolffii]TGK77434.1 peptide-binding protein [Leptospira wolffii]TGL27707.1 peptide-binding protein [Leptospira wolffii]
MKHFLNTLGLFAILALVFTNQATADSVIDGCEKPPERKDLPFYISQQRQLCKKDLEKKKEGWFPTGLPLLNSDPNTGVGYGVRVFAYNNGTKDDPFFEYTPYKFRIYAQYFNTTKQRQYQDIAFDAPYVFGTQWRLRGEAVYDANPNTLFFGLGENSLQTLSYHDRGQSGGDVFTNSTFDAQQRNLAYQRPGGPGDPVMINGGVYSGFQSQNGFNVTNTMYNRYNLISPTANLSGERSYVGGTVRLVAGLRVSQNIVRSFDGTLVRATSPILDGNPENTAESALNGTGQAFNGTTKITEDHNAGKILGYHGGIVNTLRLGLVYDTRDLEPDPNQGVFLEATYEKSAKTIGSNFDYSKYFAQAKFFWSPFPKVFDKLVLAGRGGISLTEGDAPFFEYRNMWGTEGVISGLGGRTTLRGYKQDRFVGRTMGWGNIELRWKFAQFTVLGQHFALNLVPFIDFGRVWDDEHKVNLKDYKYSKGIGFRIAWNQTTIIILDYAVSREDKQLFINFNHAF